MHLHALTEPEGKKINYEIGGWPSAVGQKVAPFMFDSQKLTAGSPIKEISIRSDIQLKVA